MERRGNISRLWPLLRRGRFGSRRGWWLGTCTVGSPVDRPCWRGNERGRSTAVLAPLEVTRPRPDVLHSSVRASDLGWHPLPAPLAQPGGWGGATSGWATTTRRTGGHNVAGVGGHQLTRFRAFHSVSPASFAATGSPSALLRVRTPAPTHSGQPAARSASRQSQHHARCIRNAVHGAAGAQRPAGKLFCVGGRPAGSLAGTGVRRPAAAANGSASSRSALQGPRRHPRNATAAAARRRSRSRRSSRHLLVPLSLLLLCQSPQAGVLAFLPHFV